jgi:hypothetical protein
MAGTIFFRLRCGHRVWSPWLNYEDQAWKVALEKGLASEDPKRGRVFPGPLVWIEKGYRPYAKRRTVPMTLELDGKPLALRHRNPMTTS